MLNFAVYDGSFQNLPVVVVAALVVAALVVAAWCFPVVTMRIYMEKRQLRSAENACYIEISKIHPRNLGMFSGD